MPSIGRQTANQYELSDDERVSELRDRRRLRVNRKIQDTQNAVYGSPGEQGVFGNAAVGGLQKPVAGLAAAADVWNHPDTSVYDRFMGGMDAYQDQSRRYQNRVGDLRSFGEGTAAGFLPFGAMTKAPIAGQMAWDAGAGATSQILDPQDPNSPTPYRDILMSMLTSAMLGQGINAYLHSQGIRQGLKKGLF